MYRTLVAKRSNTIALLVALVAISWIAISGNHGRFSHHYDIHEVDLQEAKTMMDKGAVVIDVRGQEQFANRHLPGAILIPLEVLRTGIPPSLAVAVAINKPVVVYCGKGLEHGPEGTYLLKKAGFTNVVNMKSGIEGWADAGMPVEKG